jgi:hypothetical protein
MSDQAQDDLIFWQYLFGTLGLGVLCCVNGEMWAGIEWLRTMEPSFALGLLGFYALQLIGVQAILEIVQLFDATMVGLVLHSRVSHIEVTRTIMTVINRCILSIECKSNPERRRRLCPPCGASARSRCRSSCSPSPSAPRTRWGRAWSSAARTFWSGPGRTRITKAERGAAAGFINTPSETLFLNPHFFATHSP